MGGYNGNRGKRSRTGSSRLIAVEWCTSRLRAIVFNDRVSLSRKREKAFRDSYFQSFVTKEKTQKKKKKRKKREDPLSKERRSAIPTRGSVEYA